MSRISGAPAREGPGDQESRIAAAPVETVRAEAAQAEAARAEAGVAPTAPQVRRPERVPAQRTGSAGGPVGDQAPATLEESSVLQTEVLEDLQAAVNYANWLIGLTEPWLGDDPLEIGSGLGDAAALWAAAGRPMTASEADPGRLAALRERFAEDPRVRVRELAVPIRENGDYSAVVALNVLEHIEDDVEALRDFSRLVRPGGRIVLIVPAFEQAMSEFDRNIGHFRRYRVRSMRAALQEAGLRPIKVHYVNSIGLLGWMVLIKAMNGTPSNGLPVRLYDKIGVPVLRRLERLIRPPFGQSVLAVAEKPHPSPSAQ